MAERSIALAEAQASAETRGPSVRGRWPECLALTAYAALVASAIVHHLPWVDEAQAWQLARTVPFDQLLHTYLGYEGHPAAWYAMLAGLMHLGVTYENLHWVSGALALAGVSLVVFSAPFPRYVRLALPFTFFLAFQYAVVARSYVLVPPLLFLIAMAWRRSVLVLALLLGLLGNVAMHALAISVGLAVVYALERRAEGTFRPDRTFWTAASVLLACYGFALWTVWPPADMYTPYTFGANDPLYLRIFEQGLRGLFALALGLIEPAVLAIPLWILLYRFFRNNSQTFYLLPVGAFALFSTQALKLWHAGLIVPTLITVFWIARLQKQSKTQESRTQESRTQESRWEKMTQKAFLAYVIAIQIAWTGYAVALGYRQQDSPDLATARYLAPRVQAGDKIAVTYLVSNEVKTFSFVGLEPYFQRNIFMNAERPFWFFSKKDRTEELFYEALQQHPPIVVVEVNGYSHNPTGDITGPKVDLLHRNGYALTRLFCGVQPFHMGRGIQTCHVIFERNSP
jgi:hypothetical protein